MSKPKERIDPVIPDLEGEIWKPIEGWEDSYHISNMGRVKSLSREVVSVHGITMWIKGQLISIDTTGGGRNNGKPGKVQSIELRLDGVRYRLVLAKLVLQHFNPLPKEQSAEKFCAAHRDGDWTNNRVENLYWASRTIIFKEMMKRGRGVEGIKNYGARLTEAQVLEIRDLYSKGRRPCDLERMYSVSKGAISGIIYGANWKHLLHKGASNDTKQNETTKAT